MKLRRECHVNQRAIKSPNAFIVAWFAFPSSVSSVFFGAQSGQTRRLAEVGPLTRLSRPFFFDAPPGTNGRCLWLDLQFPVNKSLAVESYTRAESNWATPRTCRAVPVSTSVTTKRRVIAGARAGDERFSWSGGEFVSNNYAHRRSSCLSVQPIPPRSFHPVVATAMTRRPN